MKKTILSIMACCICAYGLYAAPQLPGNCSASLPQQLLKPTVKEVETKALLSSGSWGQNAKANKYWTVYSDRSHNTTYNSPSTSSGKCDELNFNEEVRIAKIEGDFALAKKLLGFPYRIDCSRLEWRASSSDSSLSLIANGRTTQVLPKAGRHPVSVVFAGKKSSAFFCAEGQFLRLEFPLGQKVSSTIQEIEFQ